MSPIDTGATSGTAVPAQSRRPARTAPPESAPAESAPARQEMPPREEPRPAGGMTLPEEIRVGGTPIRFAVSGSGSRDLLLVHGYRAHHLWWYRLLPALEERWRVIRLDLSGHGDSGHRDAYSLDGWIAELTGVLDAAGSRNALLVGHSMGGRVAVVAGTEHPDRFGGLVLLDALLRPPGSVPPRMAALPAGREIVYPSRDVAATRFQLQPAQPEPAADLVRPVAEYATRPSTRADGWTWKFDQRGIPPVDNARVVESVSRLRVPVWYVRAGRSRVVTDAAAAHARAVLPAETTFVTLPDAHHHLVLDSPAECARLFADLHADLAATVHPRAATA